jgi:cell surface protein SprA
MDANNTYKYQDVGMDGLSDDDSRAFQPGLNEQQFFASYLDSLPVGARNRWQSDPSADNYHYFRGGDFDSPARSILERYKRFNGLEGNSITDEDSPEDYPTQATTLPTTEDINQDQNLSESESYFQYRIKLRPANMVVGQNFITDRILGHSPDGNDVYWYQFKVPVRQPDKVVNGIQDFRSIRFMRLFVKDWAQPVVLRFATLDFVRAEWRKYTQSLETPGEVIGGDPDQTTFDVAAVNIEENGSRTPINYVLPPGINQETDIASANLRSLNEQSLELSTCGLRDGDARAAFRNVSFDIRSYKKLRMYKHAESADPAHPLA